MMSNVVNPVYRLEPEPGFQAAADVGRSHTAGHMQWKRRDLGAIAGSPSSQEISAILGKSKYLHIQLL